MYLCRNRDFWAYTRTPQTSCAPGNQGLVALPGQVGHQLPNTKRPGL